MISDEQPFGTFHVVRAHRGGGEGECQGECGVKERLCYGLEGCLSQFDGRRRSDIVAADEGWRRLDIGAFSSLLGDTVFKGRSTEPLTPITHAIN